MSLCQSKNYEDLNTMLTTVDKRICQTKITTALSSTVCDDTSYATFEEDLAQTRSVNIFYMFLKYLYANLRDSSNATSSGSTSAAWRTFKGRLYTRLHDKRVSELDLTGIVNLAYLFFTLIKSFSSASPAISQLRFDQMENYMRILGVFIRSKNLERLESILMLSSAGQTTSASDKIQARIEAVNLLLNTKFAVLRIWFETNETVTCESSSVADNEEELKEIVDREFTGCVNTWLAEAMGFFKSATPKSMINVEFSIGENW